jgi:hypothetical protein
MANYRKPTEKETEKLNKSRQKMIEGIEGEKDIFSKMMPTMAKAARDDIRAAKAMRESVPASAREGEAYQDAGYKKGGKVKKFNDGGMSLEEKYPGAKVNRMVNKKPSNEELLAPMQVAFDNYEKKKSEAKTKAKEERNASRSKSMTMDEMGMKKGGKVSSASKRADGCAIRGKTKA